MPGTDVSLPVTPLTNEELRAENHSFLNTINVVHSELQLLERMLDERGLFRVEIHLCERAIATIRRSATSAESAAITELYGPVICRVVAVLAEREAARMDAEILHAVQVIRDVIDELEMRFQRARARLQLPGTFVEMSPATAVEQTSNALEAARSFARLNDTTNPGADQIHITAGHFDEAEPGRQAPGALPRMTLGLIRAATVRASGVGTSVDARLIIGLEESSIFVTDSERIPTLDDLHSESLAARAARIYAGVYYTAYQYGGTMTLGSASAGGTTIQIIIPAKQEEAQ